jgi:hypothetical protein
MLDALELDASSMGTTNLCLRGAGNLEAAHSGTTNLEAHSGTGKLERIESKQSGSCRLLLSLAAVEAHQHAAVGPGLRGARRCLVVALPGWARWWTRYDATQHDELSSSDDT